MSPDTVVILHESSSAGWSDLLKTIIPAVGLLGTFFTLVFGVRQYRRAEAWRRGEFAAKEQKAFKDDPSIELAETLIDWGSRKVNLHRIENATDEKLVVVTRGMQWRALLPHTLKERYPAKALSSPPRIQ